MERLNEFAKRSALDVSISIVDIVLYCQTTFRHSSQVDWIDPNRNTTDRKTLRIESLKNFNFKRSGRVNSVHFLCQDLKHGWWQSN